MKHSSLVFLKAIAEVLQTTNYIGGGGGEGGGCAGRHSS